MSSAICWNEDVWLMRRVWCSSWNCSNRTSLFVCYGSKMGKNMPTILNTLITVAGRTVGNSVGRRRPVCAAHNLTTHTYYNSCASFFLLLLLFFLSSLAGSLVVLTSEMDETECCVRVLWNCEKWLWPNNWDVLSLARARSHADTVCQWQLLKTWATDNADGNSNRSSENIVLIRFEQTEKMPSILNTLREVSDCFGNNSTKHNFNKE